MHYKILRSIPGLYPTSHDNPERLQTLLKYLLLGRGKTTQRTTVLECLKLPIDINRKKNFTQRGVSEVLFEGAKDS